MNLKERMLILNVITCLIIIKQETVDLMELLKNNVKIDNVVGMNRKLKNIVFIRNLIINVQML